MALTINITSETEQQLRQAAASVGLSPDAYALQLINRSLHPQAPVKPESSHLSQEEFDLIETVNTSLSEINWQRYQALIEKRESETLTEEEYNEILRLTDQLEKANVQRIQAITNLAQLRSTSVDDVMTSLELKPLHYI